MNKKLKLFWSLSSATLTIATPLSVLVSARAKEKEVDPNFDQFKAIAETKTKEAVKKVVEEVIKYLETELENVKKSEDNGINKIQKQVYLDEIVKHFKTKKDNIIQEPEKYGIKPLIPYTISQHKELLIIKVTYNGRVYDSIKIPKSELQKYEDLVKPDGKVETIKEIKNTLTKVEFEEAIRQYVENLTKEFNNIIYKNVDTPTLNLKLVEYEINGKKVYGYEIGFPEGYTSWEEYINKKITPRFNEFDLKQSNQLDIPQEEDPKPEELDKLPLVPGDKPKPIEKYDINKLPNLNPLIKYTWSDKEAQEIIDRFKAINNIAKANAELFFFNNPINTRYLYEVEDLKLENEKLNAIVAISDTVKPKSGNTQKRTYKIEINLDKSDNYKKNQYVLETQIDEIRSIYNKFLVAIGLDTKIDYNDLGNDNLQQTLFTMVELAAKISNIDDVAKAFKEQWKTLTKNSAYQINFGNQELLKIKNSEIRNEISNLFLNQLISALIKLEYKVGEEKVSEENVPYWHSMTKAFSRVKIQFERSIKKNREIILNNFKSNSDKSKKISSNVLDELFEKIKKDLLKLEYVSTESPLLVKTWYAKYLKLIKEIKDEFIVLKELASDKPITNANTEEFKKFIKAYEEANKIVRSQYFSENRLKKIFGSILITIGILSTIINLTIMAIRFKTNRKRKILIVYLLILTISLIMLATGITILMLGMRGI
ncbi:MSC_0620 family F1-like ATPase-associated subunit [Metamycoplasma equirhinis]|uniref:MSC_0620 family F1-like ATPase-associated subunit n=1 Tax=Metamycoplasma equirhinis TaxID=92402 RepID=UPI0035944614